MDLLKEAKRKDANLPGRRSKDLQFPALPLVIQEQSTKFVGNVATAAQECRSPASISI
jgi:hypothetical protein